MQRFKITLGYDGTAYEGWQVQACTHRPKPPTVQGILAEVISKMLGKACKVHGAGRTDSGVHALAQVCHVDIPQKATHINWLTALNRQLPDDMRVSEVLPVPEFFHAQKDALYKIYSYTICTGALKALPMLQHFCWHVPDLDLCKMQEASALLVGTHDFASFQNSGTKLPSTVRTLYAINFKPCQASFFALPVNEDFVSFEFVGNGFLKQMVRNLVGLLVWVGQGKVATSDIADILHSKKRAALPSPSAPAQGLTLVKVGYEDWQG